MRTALIIMLVVAFTMAVWNSIDLKRQKSAVAALEEIEAAKFRTCDFCGETCPKAECVSIYLDWQWHYWLAPDGTTEGSGITRRGEPQYICNDCLAAIKAHLNLVEKVKEAPNG
jgi:hypothetical protein